MSFVRDGQALVVIDPGLVPGRAAILGPLTALGGLRAHASVWMQHGRVAICHVRDP